MINWPQFGLQSNPYDTLPLVEGGPLQINKAFIGRKRELQVIKDLLLSDSNVCATILGDVGVGKTSLVNFQKFLFKYIEKEKPLFSSRREIEISTSLLNKRSFLIEIISATIQEIKLLDPGLIKKEELLQKLEKLVEITKDIDISIGVSVSEFGGDFGKGESTNYPPNIPMTTLESYFFNLIKFIKTHKIAKKEFKGLLVHTNNFDVILSDPANKKSVIKFFQEIRDMLQTKDVYYLFLGPKHFFKDIIAPHARIKSIFDLSPLIIAPLSKEELLEAFAERINLLKSPDVVSPITPFTDNVIFSLYELFQGDVRSIMNGLKAMLSQASEPIIEPIDRDRAMVLLGKERWEKVKSAALTPGQEEVLKTIAAAERDITQKEIAELLNKAPTNIASYYFEPLKDADIIEIKREEGRNKYWGLTAAYEPIKFILKSKTKERE
jgi:hypothetical protein